MPVIPPVLRDAVLVCSKGMTYRKDLAPQLFGEGLLDFYRYKAATAKMQSLVQHNSELEAKIQELQNQQYELQHKLAQSQAQCQKLKEAYATQRRIMAQLSLSEEALGLLRAALANKNPKALPYLIKTKNTESSAYQEFTLLISLMPTITRENILKLVTAAMVLSQEAAEFSAKELLDFESELMSSPDDRSACSTGGQSGCYAGSGRCYSHSSRLSGSGCIASYS